MACNDSHHAMGVVGIANTTSGVINNTQRMIIVHNFMKRVTTNRKTLYDAGFVCFALANLSTEDRNAHTKTILIRPTPLADGRERP